MAGPDDHPTPESDLEWDEVVDIVCVGGSPGVLAYAICCAANDLDVLMVRPPAEPDGDIAAWHAAMTADLDPRLNPGRENTAEDRPGFSFARLAPPPAPTGKRVTLETFVGEHLRQWSAHCLQSPFGVMFTQIPELLLPMRTDDGESVTAAFVGELGAGNLVSWLGECAREHGLADPKNIMAAMVFEEGRIAGVELDDGYLVAARGGLAFPVGAEAPGPDLPSSDGCTVAVVGRPAGRFATVNLLKP